MQEADETILKKIFTKRPENSKKGDYGHLLIIGGSRRYSGAPALAGLAALKTGADIVTIASPKRAADIIAGFAPELITESLRGDYLSRLDLGILSELSKNATAVLIGNGLERKSDTKEAITSFIKDTELPIIVDADAIYVLKEIKKELSGKKIIITPHSHEFRELTGQEAGRDENERLGSVFRAAADLKSIILLKGNIDVISDGVKTAINKTGNAYMTKGGTGDILAGIAASLVAQKNDLFESALAAAYICGKAGDFAAKEKKQSLLATDVIEKIPEAI